MTLLLLLAGGGGPSIPDDYGVTLEGLGVRLVFEVSESQPFAPTQVWHDFSGYVHRTANVSVDRGRSHQFDDVRAGTLGMVLDATNGDLDPRNALSPHADCLKPRRQCRLRLVYDDVVYPVFRGFTKGFPRIFERPNIQALIPFEATDGFRVMGNADPTTGLLTIEHPTWGAIGSGKIGGVTLSDQLSGELIESLLDSIGWPEGLRDIATGSVIVSGEGLTASGLTAMKDAADAEGGEFYIDREGSAVMRDRLARYVDVRSTTPQAAFYPREQAPPAPTYTSPFRIEQDETRIVNDARYTGESGVPQTVRDVDSIGEYGINDDQRTLIAVNDPDVHGLAWLTVTENAEPSDRFEQLVVHCHGTNKAQAIPAVLGRELFDLIELEVEPTYTAPVESVEAVIQGVHIEIGQTHLTGTFRLGPYHPRSFLTIEDASLGAIDGASIAP